MEDANKVENPVKDSTTETKTSLLHSDAAAFKPTHATVDKARKAKRR